MRYSGRIRAAIILTAAWIGILLFIFNAPKDNTDSNSDSKPRATSSERAALDRKVARHWIDLAPEMISDCTVDSSDLGSGGKIVFVRVYFKKIPTDFRESIERICEDVHDIYNSGVVLRAYRQTSSGSDHRLVGKSEWDYYSKRVKAEVY